MIDPIYPHLTSSTQLPQSTCISPPIHSLLLIHLSPPVRLPPHIHLPCPDSPPSTCYCLSSCPPPSFCPSPPIHLSVCLSRFLYQLTFPLAIHPPYPIHLSSDFHHHSFMYSIRPCAVHSLTLLLLIAFDLCLYVLQHPFSGSVCEGSNLSRVRKTTEGKLRSNN